jgi:hypothetical protein
MKQQHRKHRQAWSAALAGLQLVAVLAAGAANAKPPAGGDAKPFSLVHANERTMPISPRLCDDLGFVPGSVQLSANTPRAIDGIYRQWRSTNTEQNDVVLIVQADSNLSRDAAARQASQRAKVLARALLQSGIAQPDVFVWPPSNEVNSLTLSCPPIR